MARKVVYEETDGNDVVIQLDSKVIVLKIQEFDSNINTDEILRIDYSNLLGEILTFPLLLDRIGNLKAEIDSMVQVSKFNLEVLEAQLTESHQIELAARGEKKPTLKDVEVAVLKDPTFKEAKLKHLGLLKHQALIESLYWSAKSKDDKLNKLSDKVRIEDFEKDIVVGTINNVVIKCTKKAIQ